MQSTESERYNRQIILPEFGEAAQNKLRNGKVLVAGAGGLGCPVLQYLVAMGVGNIGIVDHDSVSLSNLHRQILFTTDDVGRKKVIVARERLRASNPEVKIASFGVQLNSTNIVDIIANYDIIVDGTDNLPARYLINDACVMHNKTLVQGSVHKFEGQVAVFNHADSDGNRGPNYRDLFPVPADAGSIPSCNEAGILGTAPGIVGMYMAQEIIKLLTGVGTTMAGKVLYLDINSGKTRHIQIPKRTDLLPISYLQDIEQTCTTYSVVKKVSYTELMHWDLDTYQLIDVREKEEVAKSSIGGINIPLTLLEDNIPLFEIPFKKVIYCKSGIRSQKAVDILQEKHSIEDLFSLEGGINAALNSVGMKVKAEP